MPREVKEWMEEAVVGMVEGLCALHAPVFLPPGFLIDLSQHPYEVPCPACLALALEACRHEAREGARRTAFGSVPGAWPASSRMVKEPHEARWTHWRDRPELRVRALL